jgi:predicted RNase H-like nuclease (RuvC/YqgF family)
MSLSKVTVQYAKMEVGCTTVPTVYQAELRRLRDENSRLRKKVIHARFENITLEDALKKAEARLESEHVKDLESKLLLSDDANYFLSTENEALYNQVQELSTKLNKKNKQIYDLEQVVGALDEIIATMSSA